MSNEKQQIDNFQKQQAIAWLMLNNLVCSMSSSLTAEQTIELYASLKDIHSGIKNFNKFTFIFLFSLLAHDKNNPLPSGLNLASLSKQKDIFFNTVMANQVLTLVDVLAGYNADDDTSVQFLNFDADLELKLAARIFNILQLSDEDFSTAYQSSLSSTPVFTNSNFNMGSLCCPLTELQLQQINDARQVDNVVASHTVDSGRSDDPFSPATRKLLDQATSVTLSGLRRSLARSFIGSMAENSGESGQSANSTTAPSRTAPNPGDPE